MKIDQPGINPSAPAERVPGDATRPLSRHAATPADAVHLSGDLRLADEAVRAATLDGQVRPDAVARGRELLARGALGTDLERLAERMIGALTETVDDGHS